MDTFLEKVKSQNLFFKTIYYNLWIRIVFLKRIDSISPSMAEVYVK